MYNRSIQSVLERCLSKILLLVSFNSSQYHYSSLQNSKLKLISFLKMVNTRPQASQNSLPREDEMDDFCDNTSDLSLPGIGTRTFKIENNSRDYEDQ